MITLEFPDIPFSLNEYKQMKVRRAGKGFSMSQVRGMVLTEYKQYWAWLVKIAMGEIDCDPEHPLFTKPVIIKPELFKAGLPYDNDNFWGGMKPVIDFMVRFGIFVDDTPDLIKHGDPVWHNSKLRKMILTIEEV